MKKIIADCRICEYYIPGCTKGAACKLETCIFNKMKIVSRHLSDDKQSMCVHYSDGGIIIEKLFPIYLADLRELANEEGVIFEELFLCADNQEFVHAVLLEE